jgi:serine/threonine protein kinase
MTRLAVGSGLVGGRYRLEGLLGAGGMASVWLARDERLGRRVAVKVISDALAVDDAYVARFEREARVAAPLLHRNLVKVFDYDADWERPLLVMEYVEGGSLADRMADETARDFDVVRLASDLLAALEHIHAAGIVHRDVKPANVLFAPDGRALLTDFGIAHPDDATRLTRTGQLVGTLRYLAPELADGHAASPRSDLYSCGVLLRECAGGSAPPELAEVIEELTQAEPGRRPASAGAALARLRRDAPAAPTRELETEIGPTGRLPATCSRGALAGRLPAAAALSIRSHPRNSLLAAAAALIVLAVATASSGDGGRPTSPGPAPASPGAPLDKQLDTLERQVREAGPGHR